MRSRTQAGHVTLLGALIAIVVSGSLLAAIVVNYHQTSPSGQHDHRFDWQATKDFAHWYYIGNDPEILRVYPNRTYVGHGNPSDSNKENQVYASLITQEEFNAHLTNLGTKTPSNVNAVPWKPTDPIGAVFAVQGESPRHSLQRHAAYETAARFFRLCEQQGYTESVYAPFVKDACLQQARAIDGGLQALISGKPATIIGFTKEIVQERVVVHNNLCIVPFTLKASGNSLTDVRARAACMVEENDQWRIDHFDDDLTLTFPRKN